MANQSRETHVGGSRSARPAGDQMRAALGKALDVGITELDRGQGIESSVEEFMDEIDAVLGLGP
jgi:hypothetical protein